MNKNSQPISIKDIAAIMASLPGAIYRWSKMNNLWLTVKAKWLYIKPKLDSAHSVARWIFFVVVVVLFSLAPLKEELQKKMQEAEKKGEDQRQKIDAIYKKVMEQ